MTVTQAREKGEETAWKGATVGVKVGSTSGETALAEATRLVAKEGFQEQVGFLLEHVGPYVVAASLGLSDTRQLTKWHEGTKPKGGGVMIDRVHLLFQVAYAITFAYAGETAARFLRSSNPLLGDEAPMILISGDPQEARVPVLGAVRALLD